MTITATGDATTPHEQQVGHLLRRAYAVARTNTARALVELGDVSPVQASTLMALSAGPLTQAELGRRVGMEPGNTHTLVRRMIAAGLIALRGDPAHRRMIRVARTEHGEKTTAALAPLLAASSDLTLSGLTTEERDMLLKLLRRVVRCGEQRAGSDDLM